MHENFVRANDSTSIEHTVVVDRTRTSTAQLRSVRETSVELSENKIKKCHERSESGE